MLALVAATATAAALSLSAGAADAPPAAVSSPAPAATPSPGPAAAARPPARPVELPEAAARALREQLQAMNDAGRRGDRAALVAAMHPRIVQELGGRQRAMEQLAELEKGMKAQGAVVEEAKVKGVRACVRAGNQLQCLVEGTQLIRVPGGNLRGETETVAFSDDGGRRWTFVASGQSPEALRQGLPELAPELPLRDVPPPRFEAR